MWQVWFRYPNDPNDREWHLSCESRDAKSLQAYIDFVWAKNTIEYELRPPTES